MPIAIPKGVFDLLPLLEGAKEPWKDSALWLYVERTIHEVARLFSCKEIRTPIFERTQLWLRGVGEHTDIVSKEMYTFSDKAGRSMSLRPEGTAPVVRAFVDHALHQQPGVHKLYYIAPMFRYERQQAGRYRQHHQFGVEVIGDGAAERDAELIDLLFTLFHRLGLRDLTLEINSIGSNTARSAYRTALVDYLTPQKEQLSGDSQLRLQVNPLRVLDSKDARDREILQAAPSILDFLDETDRHHFDRVQQLLADLQINYTVNPRLVRGLDYYTGTVFEITAPGIGSQNALGGGGRYDGLLKTLGGPELPALGFGAGIERIIQTLLQQNVSLPPKPHPMIVLIPLGEEARSVCFPLLHKLRQANIAAELALSEKKLKSVLRVVAQWNARFAAIIGDEELQSGQCTLKEMATHESCTVALEQLVTWLRERIHDG